MRIFFPMRNAKSALSRATLVEYLLHEKRSKGLTFHELAQQLSVNKVWLTSILMGQHPCNDEIAQKIGKILNVPSDTVQLLTHIPEPNVKPDLIKDPLIYRFNELVQVYGPSLRNIIHEEFGYGIMSAIDCKIEVDKKDSPTGKRVLVTIDGKFLPYYRGSL